MMFGLRVDVDTLWGLQRGVKNLLDLFDEVKIKATFFVPFGADETGKALKRVFEEKGFLKRVLRLQFGLRSSDFTRIGRLPFSVFNGTLIPSPRMGENHPEILLEIKRRGHEIGIHGYNHGHWRDDLLRMGEREIGEEFLRAYSGFQNVFQKTPHSSAAPGWRCTDETLRIQEKYSFKYASDTRGVSPFYPLIQISNPNSQIPHTRLAKRNGGQESKSPISNFQTNFQSPITNFKTLKTLQLPVTYPTLDELIPLGEEVKLHELVSNQNGKNHHSPITSYQLYCAHTEVEGASKISLFREFLLSILEKGAISDMTLETIAESFLKRSEEIPKNQIQWERIPGRTMEVTCQMNG
jgi:peptidoglycan/xylan/chitin deacetylase (PgdA/CDA1 family)